MPSTKSVRGMSQFGLSAVFVVFEDGTELYWARSRVLEYLNGARDRLPEGAMPMLGPDATGVGWPELRRGIADLSGRGEIDTGFVVMRWGENPLVVIERVKARMAEVERALPPGVTFVVGYDRSGLIERAIARLPDLAAGEVQDLMPAHRARVTRLIEMHRRMLASM